MDIDDPPIRSTPVLTTCSVPKATESQQLPQVLPDGLHCFAYYQETDQQQQQYAQFLQQQQQQQQQQHIYGQLVFRQEQNRGEQQKQENHQVARQGFVNLSAPHQQFGSASYEDFPAPRRSASEETSIEPCFPCAMNHRKRKFESFDTLPFGVTPLCRNLCSSPALLHKNKDEINYSKKEFAQRHLRQHREELIKENIGTVEKRRRPQPVIYLRTLDGRVVPLEFTGAAQTVRMVDISEQASEVLGLPVDAFRLMYDKQIVSDLQHNSLHIPLGSVLHMVLQVGQ